MKQLISFVMLVIWSVIPVSACVKKQSYTLSDPLTVLVMDTTQSLLSEAVVQVGKAVYRTSWDGRVVIQPEQLNGVRRLTVSCKGYETRKISLSDSLSSRTVVALTPHKTRPTKEHPTLGVIGTRKSVDGAILYKTSMVAEAADMSYAAGALPVNHMENAQAGRLTAGEVNDFAKWYFWPQVMDGSHKQFISTWCILPRHRYTVQVVNNQGYPVAGRAVSLLDRSGNTLFQAVTDNTGKAELWYQLISNGLCGKHAPLQIRVDEQVQDAKDWSEGMNTFVLDEPCEASENVDVLFVFDATGSMGDELRYLCEEMKDVIARAQEATGGLAIRTGAVVYRDHGDEYVTRLSCLTEDIKTTQRFIDRQQAMGGGDYEEAIPEALMAAMNSAGWDSEARARIAFLILDAPCHQDSATLALLHEQVLNAAALGVRIVPVVCSGLGESGEYLLRSVALATNGTSFFLTDDSGIGHPHLRPTTDSMTVEHLNDMLVRTIVEFSTMPGCEPVQETDEEENVSYFIPNPFETRDLENGTVEVPYGEGILYIVDVSGKLMTVVEGDFETFRYTQAYRLPIGVYFLKAYINGQWYTRKFLVQP